MKMVDSLNVALISLITWHVGHLSQVVREESSYSKGLSLMSPHLEFSVVEGGWCTEV